MRQVVKKICKFCGQEFYCENWENKRGRKYCSRKCSKQDVSNFERNKIYNKTCIDCGKPISKRSTRCLACVGKRRRTRPMICASCGTIAPDERGFRGKLKLCQKCAMKKHGIKKKKRIFVKCHECGKVIEIRPSELKEYNFCSHKCSRKYHPKWMQGENSHFWKGGTIEYYGPNWRRRRRQARKRADHQCEYCHKTKAENGKALDVHHIKSFRSFNYVPGKNDNYKLANSLDNLVALCMNCHRLAEHKSIVITSRSDLNN